MRTYEKLHPSRLYGHEQGDRPSQAPHIEDQVFSLWHCWEPHRRRVSLRAWPWVKYWDQYCFSFLPQWGEQASCATHSHLMCHGTLSNVLCGLTQYIMWCNKTRPKDHRMKPEKPYANKTQGWCIFHADRKPTQNLKYFRQYTRQQNKKYGIYNYKFLQNLRYIFPGPSGFKGFCRIIRCHDFISDLPFLPCSS